MNWNFAKNLSIIFLVILNVFLAVMVYGNSPRYALTSREEAAIRKVFTNNKVMLETNILKSYKPMPELKMPMYSYDTDDLKKIFFKDQQAIKRRDEFNEIIFENGSEILSILGSDITYETTAQGERDALTPDAAKKLCDEFLDESGDYFRGYALDGEFDVPGEIRLCYRQVYKNQIIYSNYINFTVTPGGIVRIEYTHSQPMEFDKAKKEIRSPDEAMFNLLQELKNKYGEKSISITKMDMVYNQKEKSGELSTVLKAAPCYRFYVSNELEPYLINAYTGEVES